jgi:hypothetical protein
MQYFQKKFIMQTLQLVFILSVTTSLSQSQAWADATVSTPDSTGATGGGTANVSTGYTSGSILGNGSQQASGVGNAVNGGSVNGSNLNANQNANTNLVQPILVSQPDTHAGSAALILPRNPLPLPNASAGRSNFGLQFGVQNNPGISALTGGKENGLGWFMQGGLTIPFGKIPAPYQAQNASRMDELRRDQMDERRQVFGRVASENPALSPHTDVQGRVMGLNAYNYSTVQADKLPVQQPANVGEIVMPQPKVLALKPAPVFTQPLNTGEQIGDVQVGKEYVYLGHTKSGWVKILMPNGKEAWTSTQFEYLKFDYTQVDSLAVDPTMMSRTKAASATPTGLKIIKRTQM